MTITHAADPAQDHPVELALDYALSDPDALVGISPDQRYEEMRRQLLAGPLAATNDSGGTTPDLDADINGDHHFNPDIGTISGTMTLTGVIHGHDRMTPEEMITAARPHFVNALAQDINAGFGDNLKQHAAQRG